MRCDAMRLGIGQGLNVPMKPSLDLEYKLLDRQHFLGLRRALVAQHGLAHCGMKHARPGDDRDVLNDAVLDQGLGLDDTLGAVAQCLARHFGRRLART